MVERNVELPYLGPNGTSRMILPKDVWHTSWVPLVQRPRNGKRKHVSDSDGDSGRGGWRTDAEGDVFGLVYGRWQQNGVGPTVQQWALGRALV
jgi:hypothetical protein